MVAIASIEVSRLTKRFGSVLAVDDLSFSVGKGRVTGFLGPNGAGKTTTLRALLGLVTPTSGTATFSGRPYHEHPEPIRKVGALLDASGFHPGRRAIDHLRVLATAAGMEDVETRAESVLAQVGLSEAAGRRVKGFSMGMRQRLGLAAALIGEPEILVLDEPANGLDPEGIRWLRGFLRNYADRGGTVLVSSHGLAEVAQMADDVVIISRGRLVTNSPLLALTAQAGEVVRVRTPQAEALRGALVAIGLTVEITSHEGLLVTGAAVEAVGEAAARAGIAVHELSSERSNLEDVFLNLTSHGGQS
ncbi:MAG: ABC transporter ATP-binding protein [Acidimicrobiia bacterium]